MTHNHPTAGGSFSPEDVRLAVGNDAAELRVVGAKYRYRMQRPEEGWPDWGERVEPVWRDADSAAFDDERVRVNLGELQPEEALRSHWHEVWQRVGESLQIPYERTEW